MRITALETIQLAEFPNLLFLRLHTDEGLIGLGEATGGLSTKRDTTWNGSKVHLTESCDAEGLNLITDVQTTPATTPDGLLTRPIQAALAMRRLLPAEQYVDSPTVS